MIVSGNTPHEYINFLFLLASVIGAVDVQADLLLM